MCKLINRFWGSKRGTCDKKQRPPEEKTIALGLVVVFFINWGDTISEFQRKEKR